MKIAIATQNQHKAKELSEMLNIENLEVYTMKDLGINLEIEENGKTFEENALIKAETLSSAISSDEYIVIADDSGLCVDALDGRPGIYSARYSGQGDKANNEKLIEELKNVPALKRTAHFVCAIAAIYKGEKITFTGRCEGLIDKEERGTDGFGFDPLFYYPLAQKTFGEMNADEKNKISHRANAVKLLKEWIIKQF